MNEPNYQKELEKRLAKIEQLCVETSIMQKTAD